MPLYKQAIPKSARMGYLETLSYVQDLLLVEIGSIGHSDYARKWIQATIPYPALLYTIPLTQKQLIMGDLSVVEKGLEELIQQHHPRIIFIIESAIVTTIGLNLQSVCNKLENQYGISIVDRTLTMKNDEKIGKTLALYDLCRYLCIQPDIKTETFNIIGNESISELLISILEKKYHLKLNIQLPSNISIGSLEKLTQAKLNIVISEEGLKAAKYLKRTYQMNYVEEIFIE